MEDLPLHISTPISMRAMKKSKGLRNPKRAPSRSSTDTEVVLLDEAHLPAELCNGISTPRAAPRVIYDDTEWVDEGVKFESQGFSKISPDSEVLMVDNDVVIRSLDGAEFKVHPYPLMKSSSYFRGIFERSGVPYPPIPLEQDARTLGVILKLLCPDDSEPERLATDQLLPILQAVEKLEITSHVVRTWLDARIQDEAHPLRSWALAAGFGFPGARRTATERYMIADSYFLEDRPLETRNVDGWSLFELVSAKGRAIAAARGIMTGVDWGCGRCEAKRCRCGSGSLEEDCCDSRRPMTPRPCYVDTPVRPVSPGSSPLMETPSETASPVADITVVVNTIRDPSILPLWRREYLARSATMNPFGHEATSDLIFEVCALASGCEGCRLAYNTGGAKSSRKRVRDRIQSILASAITEAVVA